MRVSKTSGKALINFWTRESRKGRVNSKTAYSLRVAGKAVLASSFDAWQKVELKDIDLDDVADRFQQKGKDSFKPKTLKVYGMGFKRAITSYLEYLRNPSDWNPPGRGRSAEFLSSNGSRGTKSSNLVPIREFLEHTFPLHGGAVAQLRLPRELKRVDAKRLTAFLEALAID